MSLTFRVCIFGISFWQRILVSHKAAAMGLLRADALARVLSTLHATANTIVSVIVRCRFEAGERQIEGCNETSSVQRGSTIGSSRGAQGQARTEAAINPRSKHSDCATGRQRAMKMVALKMQGQGS